jgi:S-DNA-T family DNA segregation ATPase FtsK/SpoIIIE
LHIKAQGKPLYDETITQTEDEALGLDGSGGERDELFEDTLRICVEMKRASTSVLQRRFVNGFVQPVDPTTGRDIPPL